MRKRFYDDGLRFQCQGSGNCCVSRGEYGYVFLTEEDRANMAKELKISLKNFEKNYCEKTQGVWHLKEIPGRPECLFLENKKCSIYKARPTQCRTWPFWPEVMNAKTWKKEVATFCPGVGKGKLHSKAHIEREMAIQKESEKLLDSEQIKNMNPPKNSLA